MTTLCASTTATPHAGEVAWGYWQTLCFAATSAGIPMDDSRGLPQEGRAIPVERYLALFQVGIDRCEDFGLRVGKAVSLKTFPVLGMTLLSCRTVRQVLQQILRYESLNHDLGVSVLHEAQDASRFFWTPNPRFIPDPASPLALHLALSVFAGIRTFAPWLLPGDVRLQQLTFCGARPEADMGIQQFFQTPIRYHQSENSLRFDSRLLDQEIAGSDPSLFDTLASHANQLLSASPPSVAQQLKAMLPDALRNQAIRIDEVAAHLHMSARTLQRKLRDEGFTYQALVDDTRRRLAERYLLDKQRSINEIAALLGYQEQSSFNHAFKLWTGRSPSDFRENRPTNAKD